jgi:hypothetical protein
VEKIVVLTISLLLDAPLKLHGNADEGGVKMSSTSGDTQEGDGSMVEEMKVMK